MQNTLSKSTSINEGVKDILLKTNQRKRELEGIILNYKNDKIVDLAIILVKLYSDFEYFISENKDLKNSFLIINLIQIEIDSKEGHLKYLKSKLGKSNIHQSEFTVPKGDPKGIEIFNEVIKKTKVVKKCIEDYINSAGFGENKDKVMNLVFACYEDIEIDEDDLVKSFHKANAVLDTIITRFGALQFTKALSFIDILTFRLGLLDMNSLINKLYDSGYKDVILDLPNGGINGALKGFEYNPSFKQADNFYFFGLVKEFNQILNGDNELSQQKKPMFSPEITAVILERIKWIESVYGDANLFD